MPIQPADLSYRLVAWIIDIILISIITNIIFLIINPRDIWRVPFTYIDPIYWWFTNLIQFAFGFLYYWGFESFNNGQTLGKMALKLRTVDENTMQVTSKENYALNNLFKGSALVIVDLIIGFFVSYDSAKRKIRIMQDVSNTIVVKETLDQ